MQLDDISNLNSLEHAKQLAGQTGLLYIFITIVCIGLAFWALQAFRFDVLLRDPKGRRAKALQVMLSIVIGYNTARFILDYLSWSLVLKSLF